MGVTLTKNQKNSLTIKVHSGLRKVEKSFAPQPRFEPGTLCVIGQRSPTLLQSQITNQGFKTHINVPGDLDADFRPLRGGVGP